MILPVKQRGAACPADNRRFSFLAEKHLVLQWSLASVIRGRPFMSHAAVVRTQKSRMLLMCRRIFVMQPCPRSCFQFGSVFIFFPLPFFYCSFEKSGLIIQCFSLYLVFSIFPLNHKSLLWAYLTVTLLVLSICFHDSPLITLLLWLSV